MGLSTGIALLESKPGLTVTVADKEPELALHASGRNSGVLHAGFYYSPDSLKAKFCRDGNKEIRLLAKKHSIPIQEVGKVVVVRNEGELAQLQILFERGVTNGVDLEILEESKLSEFEPLAVTKEKFIWSPTTAVANPKAITKALYEKFISLGGKVEFDSRVTLASSNEEILDSSQTYDSQIFINAAGAQADRISRSIGVGNEYAMLPFMGVYRSVDSEQLPLKRLVYPVPHPLNPFLGVHFTLTTNQKVKIGPTAIPILGREQYSLFQGWSRSDIVQSLKAIRSLLRGDSHDLVQIMRTEWPKVMERSLVKESLELVPSASKVRHWQKRPPGIRAQLVHLPTGRLEQDFVVTEKLNSIHILNAVSPGWTSAIPFGRFVAAKLLRKLT